MTSIQSLGVGSGLLTSELVDDIIAAEREATDLRLDAEKAEFEARISSYGSIKSTLATLRTSADELSRSSSLLSNATTTTDETVVTAAAQPGASPGVHTVEVQTLARNHTLASIRFDDMDTVVGDGTLTVRFGTTTFNAGSYDTFTVNPEVAGGAVTIDGSNSTVEGIRDAVNEADIGVRASIVNDGVGYVLVFTSERSGEAHSMEITVTEGGTPGLSALAFNAAASTPDVNMTQAVAADDARMLVDGILVQRDSNVFDEVVQGVTFNALSTNPGEPATITISQDTEDIVARVESFVTAFNEAKALTDSLTAFDEDAGSGALLMGDPILRNLRSQMRRLLINAVPGVGSVNVRSLVDLGISTDQNADYALRFDPAKLEAALAASPEDVVALLADQARASDDLVRFQGFQPDTAAGTYDVVITQVATRGLLEGATTPGLDSGITIDDDNDELRLTVDGVASGGISLTQGVYADADSLAQMMTAVINAAAPLASAGVAVDVSYDDANQRLEITSRSFGSASQVDVTLVDTNTTAELGLGVVSGEGTAGVDVAGSINGLTGTGSGQFLSIPTGPPPATSGSYTGAAVTSFDTPPLTLDASNNSFALSVDGVGSGSIVLTPGSYADGASLAAEMQARINEDPALDAAGKSVTVEWDVANQRLRIISGSTSNGSRVDVLSIVPGAEPALGLTVGSGVAGTPAGRVPDPAGGAQIQVLGGETGARGQLTLVRGVMNQFDQYLDGVLNFGGTLDTKLDVLEARIADLDTEAAEFDDRMDRLEERLRTQFASADALISQLNSTASFLDRQLAGLPGYVQRDE